MKDFDFGHNIVPCKLYTWYAGNLSTGTELAQEKKMGIALHQGNGKKAWSDGADTSKYPRCGMNHNPKRKI